MVKQTNTLGSLMLECVNYFLSLNDRTTPFLPKMKKIAIPILDLTGGDVEGNGRFPSSQSKAS